MSHPVQESDIVTHPIGARNRYPMGSGIVAFVCALVLIMAAAAFAISAVLMNYRSGTDAAGTSLVPAGATQPAATLAAGTNDAFQDLKVGLVLPKETATGHTPLASAQELLSRTGLGSIESAANTASEQVSAVEQIAGDPSVRVIVIKPVDLAAVAPVLAGLRSNRLAVVVIDLETGNPRASDPATNDPATSNQSDATQYADVVVTFAPKAVNAAVRAAGRPTQTDDVPIVTENPAATSHVRRLADGVVPAVIYLDPHQATAEAVRIADEFVRGYRTFGGEQVSFEIDPITVTRQSAAEVFAQAPRLRAIINFSADR